MIRVIKWVIAILIMLVVFLGVVMMSLNMHVQSATKDMIVAKMDSYDYELTDAELKELKELDADCIMVLGCGVTDYDTPSPMLKDRLDVGIYLYEQGVAPKLLLSGDNSTDVHNEIHVMLKYAREAGIPNDDIFCDHAGVSTYDSVYRLISIFQADKVVIVTQNYHLYRALYIAKELDIKALGVASDQRKYSAQGHREIREVLARNKDFFKVRSGAESTVGGDPIPISGSGVESQVE